MECSKERSSVISFIITRHRIQMVESRRPARKELQQPMRERNNGDNKFSGSISRKMFTDLANALEMRIE